MRLFIKQIATGLHDGYEPVEPEHIINVEFTYKVIYETYITFHFDIIDKNKSRLFKELEQELTLVYINDETKRYIYGPYTMRNDLFLLIDFSKDTFEDDNYYDDYMMKMMKKYHMIN